MSNSDLTSILFLLLVLVGLAQLLGYFFVKLRQPKVVGEIMAGVVLGPAILGRFSFGARFTEAAQHQGNILNFVYWLGLLLLMFLAGAETRHLFSREERREVAWLGIVGTGIPFVLAIAMGPWLIRPSLAGPNGNRWSLMIVIAVGVAVTSVPVVSKIFADLKILHTRFARLILGVAVLEDIVLWLALAVATAMAGKTALDPRQMSYHLITTVDLRPRPDAGSADHEAHQQVALQCDRQVLAGRIRAWRLAGLLRGRRRARRQHRLCGVSRGLCRGAQETQAVRGGAGHHWEDFVRIFIPVYFAIVGLKLDLVRGLSLRMLAVFLVGSCVAKFLSVGLAGRMAGFRGLDLVNLALTANARGGPGLSLQAWHSMLASSARSSIQRW